MRSWSADLPREAGWGFALRQVYNSGVSFGRLSGSADVLVVAVAALSAGVAVALVLAPPRYRLGLGILLGGSVGNLIDRVRFGAVLDFVDVPWWPTFNVADVAIVAGVVLVVLQVLRAGRA